ncbi:MAG: VPLPA-CTERM sorting domain-containing protein [Phycisphaerales bacterium]
MNTTKSCLFGGALFAAGVAGQADANIDFESNFGGAYPTSFTLAYATDGSTYFGSPNAILNQYVSYSPGTSPVAPALAIGYGYVAYGYVSNTYMAAVAYGGIAGGAGVGIGQAYAYFSAGTTQYVNIQWDFSNEFNTGSYGFYGDIALVDWTAGGVTVFSIDLSLNPGDPLAGSVNIALAAGTNYSLLLDAGATQGGDAFATATFSKIPAPASAGLLGLAGIAAVRRRR